MTIECIYRIINLLTGRVYIGSTTNYVRRVQAHKNDLRAKKHRNKALQADEKGRFCE